MHRRFLTVTAVLTCMVAFTAVALAAHPKKGGVYKGVITSSPFQLTVRITVSSTGKKLTFTYLCGTGRAPTTARRVPIDTKGHFAHNDTLNGNVLVWRMSGHFISATKAFVAIKETNCGGSNGATTLTLK